MSPGHKHHIEDNEVEMKKQEKLVSREKKIGSLLGTIVYYLKKLGRPDTDFPIIVSMLSKAGVDCGDINHSARFPAKWAPVCADDIQGRLKGFLAKPLVQTGYRPKVKKMADKATWQHKTRMVSGLLTVIPDSDTLLQAFVIGSGCCPGASWVEMTRSLTTSTD